MATEREEIRYEGGRGGKFQTRPVRRSHTTPYDRPPTALRNSTTKGWLSMLVDPAHKLITSGARTLFSTVFRKRLPPPPTLPLSRAAPIFKFGSSSVPSTSVSPLSAPTGVGSVETKSKQETTFGNLSGIPPSETSAKISSTGSIVFQFGAASTTTSDSNKRSENSTFVPGNPPAFGAPVLPASSGVASSSQSTPIMQFSSSSTSFGLAGNTALSSGSSLFASSTRASILFNSGTTFRLVSSSSSDNNSISSSSGTSPSFFNWQPSSAPSFSTGFNSTPSGGFSFGLTSYSAASNSAAMLFGSSTGASTASVFSFTSAATAASSQPAFGNSNHAFTFGSTPSVNHDQGNMVDSMAEDTVQTVVPLTPSFGQQPLTPPPPSSGFVFGATSPPPLAASPFQFGSQQSVPTPQNPSPFQASGSLDFNATAGGSFSFGAGGGNKSNRKYVKVKSGRSRKK